MTIVLLILAVALAAGLNAVMDVVENENFSQSVFRKLNPAFWYKRESWKTAPRIFGWKFDAWHVAKSGMVILLLAAAKPITGRWWVDLLILGVVWNLTFNFLYTYFARKGK